MCGWSFAIPTPPQTIADCPKLRDNEADYQDFVSKGGMTWLK